MIRADTILFSFVVFAFSYAVRSFRLFVLANSDQIHTRQENAIYAVTLLWLRVLSREYTGYPVEYPTATKEPNRVHRYKQLLQCSLTTY